VLFRSVTDFESALNYTLFRLDEFKREHNAIIEIRELDEGVSVSIPVEFLHEAFELESELCDMGISFDTGCGFGFRDWELDWSFNYKG